MSDTEGAGSGANLGTYAQLAAGMAIVGSGTPTGKLVSEAFPVFVASGLRVALAAAILVPLALWRRDDGSRLDRRTGLLLVLAGVLGSFLSGLLNLYGLRAVPPILAGLLASTTPGITAVGAMFVFGEAFGRARLIGVILTFLGVLAASFGEGQGSSSSGGGALLGVLVLAGAVGCDAANTLLQKAALKSVGPITVAAMSAAVALGLFLPPALSQWKEFAPPHWLDGSWIALIWMGIGPGSIGLLLWLRGVRRVSGGTAAVFMALMPVSATLLSYALTDATFSWLHVAGLVAVLAGILCAGRDGG